jgi:hypothetical protein
MGLHQRRDIDRPPGHPSPPLKLSASLVAPYLNLGTAGTTV